MLKHELYLKLKKLEECKLKKNEIDNAKKLLIRKNPFLKEYAELATEIQNFVINYGSDYSTKLLKVSNDSSFESLLPIFLRNEKEELFEKLKHVNERMEELRRHHKYQDLIKKYTEEEIKLEIAKQNNNLDDMLDVENQMSEIKKINPYIFKYYKFLCKSQSLLIKSLQSVETGLTLDKNDYVSFVKEQRKNYTIKRDRIENLISDDLLLTNYQELDLVLGYSCHYLLEETKKEIDALRKLDHEDIWMATKQVTGDNSKIVTLRCAICGDVKEMESKDIDIPYYRLSNGGLIKKEEQRMNLLGYLSGDIETSSFKKVEVKNKVKIKEMKHDN